MPFISYLVVVARTSGTMLNKVGGGRREWTFLFLNLGEELYFSSLSMLAVGFLIYGFYYVEACFL